MTLHEIEETLHELQSRHPGLNEALLVTLLRSGGWEEKNIQEALLLFRSGAVERAEETSATTVADALPSVETEHLFMPESDEKHMLQEHNEETLAHEMSQRKDVATEPMSLVENSTEHAPSKKEELPHNLPLRPFETSEHIWPFARYKDVFFGDNEQKTVTKEERSVETSAIKEEVKGEEPKAVTPPVEMPAETKKMETVQALVQEKETISIPEGVKEKPAPTVSMRRGDEKLVLMACIMLLAILLLLGYMYSNGRI